MKIGTEERSVLEVREHLKCFQETCFGSIHISPG